MPGTWRETRGPSTDMSLLTQRVLSTHMGNTYPNHKGNYYYRNHTLYHIATLDPLGYTTIWRFRQKEGDVRGFKA